jgi:glutathione S-transferase
MLNLYGFPVSHYYNMVKHTLMQKGVIYEEVTVMPGAGDDYLGKSPLGKIPCIGVEEGYLSETSSILEYIEDSFPGPRLAPADPWGRAKMRELMKVCELYIEAPARQLIPVVMQGVKDNDSHLKAIETLNKGVQALAKLGVFKPYLIGEELTLADIMLRYVLIVVRGHTALPGLNTAGCAGIDLASVLPGLEAWDRAMDASSVSQAIDAILVSEISKYMGKQSH